VFCLILRRGYCAHGTGTICLHLVVFCLILRRGYCAHGTGTICLHLVVFCLILLRRGYIRAILWDGNDLFASSCVLSHSPQTGLYYGTGTICLHLVVFCLIPNQIQTGLSSCVFGLRRGAIYYGTGTICLHLVVFCLIPGLRRGAILWDGNAHASFCPLLNFSIEMEQSSAYKLSLSHVNCHAGIICFKQRDIRIISH
jgi:hypothetical protein